MTIIIVKQQRSVREFLCMGQVLTGLLVKNMQLKSKHYNELVNAEDFRFLGKSAIIIGCMR